MATDRRTPEDYETGRAWGPVTPPKRPRDTVTGEEVKLAQGIIDAWLEEHEEGQDYAQELPYLRGLITAALAEHYADGYTDGHLDAVEGGATL